MKHYCKLEVCGRIGSVSVTKNGRSIYLHTFTICVETEYTDLDGKERWTDTNWFHAKAFLRSRETRMQAGKEIWIVGLLRCIKTADGQTHNCIFVQSYSFDDTLQRAEQQPASI